MAARGQSIHWPSVWQFGLSLLATLGFWTLAVSFALLGIGQMLTRSTRIMETTAPFLFASGLILCGFLALISAGYALSRVLGYPELEIYPSSHLLGGILRFFSRPALAILLAPIPVIAGYFIINSTKLAWLILPPLHILAVGLPVLWIIYISTRGLPKGSSQREWGIFASGLALSTSLILFFELAILVLIFIAGVVYLSSQPGLVDQLMRMLENLDYRTANPEQLRSAFEPLLLQPAIIFFIFAFTAGLVPLIEELFKPIGVWLFARRNWSPADGFVAGVLGGAGYALFENLAFTSTAENWAVLVSVRFGTALLHTATAGLSGWALVLAFNERRYFRLGFIYLCVVLFHGLWNAFSILVSAQTLVPGNVAWFEFTTRVSRFSPFVLGFMAFGAMFILLAANRKFRKTSIQSI